MKFIFTSLMFLSSNLYAATDTSIEVNDALAVASILTLFGLGFIAGCK